MRIYSKKTYIIVGKQGGAVIVGGEELRQSIKGIGPLADGDRVYEAQLFAIAKERKEIYLVDTAGDTVIQWELDESPVGKARGWREHIYEPGKVL